MGLKSFLDFLLYYFTIFLMCASRESYLLKHIHTIIAKIKSINIISPKLILSTYFFITFSETFKNIFCSNTHCSIGYYLFKVALG